MSKVAVVFWSGTGNTEQMAEAVAEGAKSAGAEVTLANVNDFDSSSVADFDSIAFGCPAMGIALFGSYGWGDGEWMRNWEDTCKGDGANLVCESVICNDAPDDDALEACKKLGASLA